MQTFAELDRKLNPFQEDTYHHPWLLRLVFTRKNARNTHALGSIPYQTIRLKNPVIALQALGTSYAWHSRYHRNSSAIAKSMETLSPTFRDSSCSTTLIAIPLVTFIFFCDLQSNICHKAELPFNPMDVLFHQGGLSL